MKRSLLTILVAVSLAAYAHAAVPLTPYTFTNLTWTQQGTSGLINTNVYLAGVPYFATNVAVMSGTNAIDLTGCSVKFRVGDSTTNLAFTGTSTPTDASNGIVSVLFTIPANTNAPGTTTYVGTAGLFTVAPSVKVASIQLTVTNAVFAVIDQEQKQLQYTVPLQ